MTLTYRIAEPVDAAALTGLAETTFRETYTAGSDPADLEAFVADSFGFGLQRAELSDPQILTIVGESDDGLQCYAQIQWSAPPPPEVDPSAVRLWRFYVLAAHHGRGAAHDLMATVEDAVARRGASHIWLGVWAPNARAVAFYRKRGYLEVGKHECHFGSKVQLDRVMVRRLGPVDQP